MQYAILFQDTVVGYSTFEEPNVFGGLAEGRFEPAPGSAASALLPGE